MNKMQEKFQITPRPEDDEHEHRWADFNKQRVIAATRDSMDSIGHSRNRTADTPSNLPMTLAMSHNNEMPPGYHIDSQHGYKAGTPGPFKEIYLAGTKDVTDNPTSRDLINGFVMGRMSPVEDMYTEEHKDDFYDSVKLPTAEGEVEGFVERANYLDRA